MNKIDIENVLANMTVEEKASMCSGSDFWHTEAIERLNLPEAMVSDGPHGLRKQEELADHMGVAESIKAICFPTASAMACSFDRDLINQVGQSLGDECQAENVAVLLGPGINMKRSPLCGRNFEYYSEDPYLAGELGTAFVNGVQSKHVGTSLKHFAANNQEWRRMSINAVIDERTLHEIYLAAFENVVKNAKPWTIMCSYNQINGTYSCENDWLLNKTLRDSWGFKGLVVTDWGAMNDRVESLKSGLDLEMPSSHGETDKLLVNAVKNGSLAEETLDTSVRRILSLVNEYLSHKQDTVYNKETHHALARKTAVESAVLLKNDGLLPLSSNQKVAFIGEFAKNPRIQGGGSSHINCFKIENAVDSAKTLFETEHISEDNFTYSKGYSTDKDEISDELIAEAASNAANADVAVIFAGLPDAFESEGFDREHMNMPNCQNYLIEEIAKVQKNTVVVLHNGSSILMPWLDKVGSVLEMYLAGQASGAAAVDLLFGKANPCGKLAETFPLRLEDNPSYLNFPGNRDKVQYSEGVFIGYRYYDKRKMDVLFPFGYGLSYTNFRYDNLRIEVNGHTTYQEALDKDDIIVSVNITNIGNIAGAEIVQLYVKNFIGIENRPEKELKDFAKVYLNPGETKTVTFKLNFRSFAYYNEKIGDWYAESGTYHIQLAASSRDIRCSAPIAIKSTRHIPFHAGDTTTCEDVDLFAKNKLPLDEMLMKSGFADATSKDDDNSMGAGTADMMKAMFAGTPLHSILSFSGQELSYYDIQDTINKINESEKNN